MEVDSEYIFVDLMDTAGEVCLIRNKIIKYVTLLKCPCIKYRALIGDTPDRIGI